MDPRTAGLGDNSHRIKVLALGKGDRLVRRSTLDLRDGRAEVALAETERAEDTAKKTARDLRRVGIRSGALQESEDTIEEVSDGAQAASDVLLVCRVLLNDGALLGL